MSEKITEKAILVTLNIGQYTGKKQDKKAERSVDTTFNTHDAGTYRKATITKDALQEIATLVNEIRTFFYTHTLPWTDESKRLKSMTDFLEFTAQLRNHERLFNDKADQFEKSYPDLIEEARNIRKDKTARAEVSDHASDLLKRMEGLY